MITLRDVLKDTGQNGLAVKDNASTYDPLDLLNDLTDDELDAQVSWIDDTIRVIGPDGFIAGGEYLYEVVSG